MHDARLSRRWVTLAVLAGASTAAAAAAPAIVGVDPVLAQIELHKVLWARANKHPGSDNDPAFQAAVHDEDAAIQALGEMTPTTIAGAAAQLLYMSEIDETYGDNGSPSRQTMLTVARALARGLPA